MDRMNIPFLESFQTGKMFRKGDVRAAAWKHVKRIGTIDNLERVATASGFAPTIANTASLRIRQAIELYEASQSTSTLTRPLLLYYCVLNLVRGALLARHGEAGTAAHGMRYIAGTDLLSSKAEITNTGTFPRLIESVWGSHAANIKKQSLSLLETLAQIPELRHEFHLINITSLVAEVHVEGYINADTQLKYFIPGITSEEFAATWQKLLPWMVDNCRYNSDLTLTLLTRLNKPEEIQHFCNRNLWRDLQWRENPVWFDQVARSNSTLLPRVASYIAGLFILSNISRYEPENLMPAIEPTNLAFVIESFLDCAERNIPLLVIELLDGPTYFV